MIITYPVWWSHISSMMISHLIRWSHTLIIMVKHVQYDCIIRHPVNKMVLHQFDDHTHLLSRSLMIRWSCTHTHTYKRVHMHKHMQIYTYITPHCMICMLQAKWCQSPPTERTWKTDPLMAVMTTIQPGLFMACIFW